MTVKLSKIVVTAEMDAAAYIRGAKQVEAANAAIAASSKLSAKELAALDAAAGGASKPVQALSKSWIDGYTGSSRFAAEIAKINKAMQEQGLSAERAALILSGIQSRFGGLGDAVEHYMRGLQMVAPLIEQLTRQHEQLGTSAENAGRKIASLQHAQMQAEQFGSSFSSDLNSRLGIGRKPVSAAASGAVFQEQFSQEEELLALRNRVVSTHLQEQHLLDIKKKNLADIATLALAGEKNGLSFAQAREATRAEEIRHEQAMRSLQGTAIYKDKFGVGGTGLARHEAVNLSRQAQDVFVSLSSGQNPMTVLIQQGTQIADIFATSNAKIGDVARKGLAWAGRFAMSLAGVTTGLVAVGAGLTYLGSEYAESQREIERNLNGIGRASGLTVQSINRIASASSNLSTSTARGILGQFGATGRIGGANAAGLLDVTKGYGLQTGTDYDKAGAELAKMFADPAKGAEELAKTIGGVDGKTLDYIRTLKAKNDTDGAQRALLDAITPRLKEAENNVSMLAKAWDWVKIKADSAADSVGRAVGGQSSLESKLDAAQAKRLFGQNFLFGNSMVKFQDSEIESIQEQIRLQGRLAAMRSNEERRARTSVEALSITDKFFPETASRRELESDLNRLKAFLNDPNADRLSENFKLAASQARQLEEVLKASLTPIERIQFSTEISVKSIMARTLQERISVELMQQQFQLSQDGAKSDKVRAETEKRIVELKAQANREARDALRIANDNYRMAGASPYQRMLQETENRFRDNRERWGGGASAPATSVPNSGRMGLDAALDLIEKLESGGKNVPNYKFGPGFTAQGHFQFTNPTWRDTAKSAGVDLDQYPNAMSAPYDVQRRAAAALYQQRGFQPWEALKNHPAARGDFAGGEGNANTLRDQERATWIKEQFTNATRLSSLALEDQTEKLELEAQKSTMSAFAIGKATNAQERISQLRQQGIPITDEVIARINAESDAYGKLAERKAAAMDRDISFERSQLGRSQGEQGIASRLRDSGFGMDSARADQMRINQGFLEIKETATGALTGFLSDLRQGKTTAEALRGQLDRILDRLINKGVDTLMSSVFGMFSGGGGGAAGGAPLSLFGGLFSANGNAFGQHGVHQFAMGGAFTNSIVNKPTLFPFANGVGLMGEAGEEAIMPLRRNGRGQLGVHVAGNDNQSSPAMIVQTTFAPVFYADGADGLALASLERKVVALSKQVEKQNVASVRSAQGRGY